MKIGGNGQNILFFQYIACEINILTLKVIDMVIKVKKLDEKLNVDLERG